MIRRAVSALMVGLMVGAVVVALLPLALILLDLVAKIGRASCRERV